MTKNIQLTMWGYVTVPVDSRLVVEVPADMTEEQIGEVADDLVYELADCAHEWEDADGRPELPEDVEPRLEYDFDADDVDDDPDCRLIRDADGKWVVVKG